MAALDQHKSPPRAPLPDAERRDALACAARYERLCDERGLWDPTGRARALVARLRAYGWADGAPPFDRVYIDECQDSTQVGWAPSRDSSGQSAVP